MMLMPCKLLLQAISLDKAGQSSEALYMEACQHLMQAAQIPEPRMVPWSMCDALLVGWQAISLEEDADKKKELEVMSFYYWKSRA